MDVIHAEYRAPLSNRIAQHYTMLAQVVSAIDCSYTMSKQYEWTGGKVSIVDMIAYHIGWGKLLISWYEAGIKGEAIIMPGAGFSTWDYVGLARYFYQTYGYDGCYEQSAIFRTVVTRIIEITEYEYETNNLDKIGVWSWCTLPSGKQLPLSKWVQVNTVAPYKRSAAVIKKQIKEIKKLIHGF